MRVSGITAKAIIFAFLPVIFFIGLVEGCLWLAGYEGDRFRSILFGDDPRSVLLFQESPRLWWKLRPNANVIFLDTPVSVDKQGMRTSLPGREGRSKPRVLCLGDSSTFGWKTPYEATYPYLLENLLKPTVPNIQVVNGGVPGYASFQCLRWFQDAADELAADVVIIYASNNEASLAEYSDRKRFEQEGRLMWLRSFLSAGRIYQFAKNTLVKTKPFNKLGTLPLDELLSLSPRVDLESYKSNLADLIAQCRRHGATPILVTVPNHVGHPYFFEIPSGIARVNTLLESAQRKIENRDFEAAMTELDLAATLDREYYKTYFLKATVLLHTKTGNATDDFEKALERHPFPERLKGSYNKAILEIGAATGTVVVDLAEVFKRHPAGPDALFVDACHPSSLGYTILVEALAPHVLQALTKNE